ncbi:sigma-70 family RNA polymerase sigma factor [Thalassospira sp.]|uniref:sigma-70 family RNA polymerase sigma factor n=1 Tax=Thalassospira sp. TaxID=1912094 RepID=UPI003AA7ABD3
MRAERQGDAKAYGQMLAEIAQSLRTGIPGRLRRLGLDPQETEDVVQEILIGLHDKRHTWDEERPFKPWLAGIVHYKLVDAVRRSSRERAHKANVSLDELADIIGDTSSDPGRALDVEKKLAALPSQQHDVVNALAIEGDTVRQAAQKLKRSEASIRVTFNRALARLFDTARSGKG